MSDFFVNEKKRYGITYNPRKAKLVMQLLMAEAPQDIRTDYSKTLNQETQGFTKKYIATLIPDIMLTAAGTVAAKKIKDRKLRALATLASGVLSIAWWAGAVVGHSRAMHKAIYRLDKKMYQKYGQRYIDVLKAQTRGHDILHELTGVPSSKYRLQTLGIS